MLARSIILLTLCSAVQGWLYPHFGTHIEQRHSYRSSAKHSNSLEDQDSHPHKVKSTSRRHWLQVAGAATTLAVPALSAHASPSLFSSLQGPAQDLIAPGHWLGQFVGLNSKTETWEFSSHSPAEVSAALVEVLNELTPERREKLLIPEFTVARADAAQVHVLTWTKVEWLDSLDVRLKSSSSPPGSGTVATASFYATGFFPTSLPLAPLLNVAMAWFPFASPGPRGEMLQEFRLRALNGLLTRKLVEKAGRV